MVEIGIHFSSTGIPGINIALMFQIISYAHIMKVQKMCLLFLHIHFFLFFLSCCNRPLLAKTHTPATERTLFKILDFLACIHSISSYTFFFSPSHYLQLAKANFVTSKISSYGTQIGSFIFRIVQQPDLN